MKIQKGVMVQNEPQLCELSGVLAELELTPTHLFRLPLCSLLVKKHGEGYNSHLQKQPLSC